MLKQGGVLLSLFFLITFLGSRDLCNSLRARRAGNAGVRIVRCITYLQAVRCKQCFPYSLLFWFTFCFLSFRSLPRLCNNIFREWTLFSLSEWFQVEPCPHQPVRKAADCLRHMARRMKKKTTHFFATQVILEG